MDLFDKISEDIKAAMLSRDTVKLDALRGVKKEFLEAKTSKEGNGVLLDEKALQIIQKLIKQRKESAELYQAQNRSDLAEKEMEEAAVIEQYLPTQMSIEELEVAIKAIIAKVGASSIKDMGKVMGMATKEFSGKAEGKAISEVVKKCLGC